MKTTEEILIELETKFRHNKESYNYWKDLAGQEESIHHHKKSHEYDAVADNYLNRNSEIAQLYSFITGDTVHDCFKILHSKANTIISLEKTFENMSL